MATVVERTVLLDRRMAAPHRQLEDQGDRWKDTFATSSGPATWKIGLRTRPYTSTMADSTVPLVRFQFRKCEQESTPVSVFIIFLP